MRMNAVLKFATLALLLPAAAIPLAAQQDYFSNWPAGSSPQEVGKALAEHFITTPHQGKTTIVYSEVGAWYGALTFAELTHDTDLRDRLIKRFDPLLPGGAEADKIPHADHVDASIFGIVPLEIAIQTKDKKYLDYGLSYADRQWVDPQPDGLSHETRYWIDTCIC
jgi:rhamnogalacturonyl hydrolase YesR